MVSIFFLKVIDLEGRGGVLVGADHFWDGLFFMHCVFRRQVI